MLRGPYRGAQEKATSRLDLRLTPAEKKILDEKATKTRRTVASLVKQLIDEIDKIIP